MEEPSLELQLKLAVTHEGQNNNDHASKGNDRRLSSANPNLIEIRESWRIYFSMDDKIHKR